MTDEEMYLLDSTIHRTNGDYNLASSHSLASSIATAFTSSQKIAWFTTYLHYKISLKWQAMMKTKL